jgi:hypothetical protein
LSWVKNNKLKLNVFQAAEENTTISIKKGNLQHDLMKAFLVPTKNG